MAIINVDDAYILNETGAQVDKTTGIPFKNESLTEAEAAQARANIRAGGSNRNLLDNWYFVGGGSQLGDGVFPINQRGQASYAANGYGIDRWICYGGAITLAADGISVPANGVFTQPTDNLTQLNGETLTLSVLYDSGIETGTAVLDLSGTTMFINNGAAGQTYITNGGLVQTYKGTASKIRAIKLEKGTVSTLANDPPPDFGEELRKCKRRFQRIYAGSPYYIFATAALAEAASYAVATLDLPVEMAAKPTLAYGGSFRLWTGTGESPHGINGMTIYDSTTPATNCSRVGLIIYSSDNITADWRYDLQADNNVGTYIDLSCEL